MYLIATMFAFIAVLFYFSSQRPQVNITIICGGRQAEVIREGVINGSGWLFRSENGDMINLGAELPANLRLNLVRA